MKDKYRINYDYLFLLDNPVQINLDGTEFTVADCGITVEFMVKDPATGEELFFESDNGEIRIELEGKVYKSDNGEIRIELAGKEFYPYELLNVAVINHGIEIERDPLFANQTFNWRVCGYNLGVYATDKNGEILSGIIKTKCVDKQTFDDFLEQYIAEQQTFAQISCFGLSKAE